MSCRSWLKGDVSTEGRGTLVFTLSLGGCRTTPLLNSSIRCFHVNPCVSWNTAQWCTDLLPELKGSKKKKKGSQSTIFLWIFTHPVSRHIRHQTVPRFHDQFLQILLEKTQFNLRCSVFNHCVVLLLENNRRRASVAWWSTWSQRYQQVPDRFVPLKLRQFYQRLQLYLLKNEVRHPFIFALK